MYKVFCAFLLITFAFANKGVDYGFYTMDRQDAKCFVQSELPLIVFRIITETLNPVSQFLSNYINALDGGMKVIDVFFSVNDKYTAEEICNAVSDNLPTSFNQIVWFVVQKGPWTREIAKRVAFLEDVVVACSNKGMKVGIHSNAIEWTYVMGSQGAGSDTLRRLPLWYRNTNANADFSDFYYAGFGGWKSPLMKEYAWDYSCGGFNALYYEDRAPAFLAK